jgi:hypothetical protein
MRTSPYESARTSSFESKTDGHCIEVIEGFSDGDISAASVFTDLRIVSDLVIEEIFKIFCHWKHKFESLVKLQVFSSVISNEVKRNEIYAFVIFRISFVDMTGAEWTLSLFFFVSRKE